MSDFYVSSLTRQQILDKLHFSGDIKPLSVDFNVLADDNGPITSVTATVRTGLGVIGTASLVNNVWTAPITTLRPGLTVIKLVASNATYSEVIYIRVTCKLIKGFADGTSLTVLDSTPVADVIAADIAAPDPDPDPVNEGFQMTVRTTGASETFTIPCYNYQTFDAVIDYGDGSATATITAYNDANLSHVYAVAGDYQITITGTFSNIYFNFAGDRLKVISVDNLGSVGWKSLFVAFYGCSNMTTFTVGDTDTSECIDMSGMLEECSSLTTLDLRALDTSSVNDMSWMFADCTNLTSVDVSSFDTSLVTSMRQMFESCSSLTSLDVTNFNTSAVTNMSLMFWQCSLLTSLDVTNFDTSSLIDASYMFYWCEGLTSLDVTNFDTSSVTTMLSMFGRCEGLTSLDVTNFNTSSVTTMYGMFGSVSGVTTLDLSNFDTSSVTSMEQMFIGCTNLTSVDLSTFDTSSCTNFSNMFRECTSLPILDLSNFDTSAARTFSNMFNGSSGLTDVIGVEDFIITATNNFQVFGNFLKLVTLPTSRYNSLLVNWSAQSPIQNSQSAHFGGSKYSAAPSAAATARALLISAELWTITDGGPI